MLSTALAAYLDERDIAEFAGAGLATFLRLARSDAANPISSLLNKIPGKDGGAGQDHARVSSKAGFHRQ